MAGETRNMVECLMRDSIELHHIIKDWNCVGVDSPKQVIPLYYEVIKEIIDRDRRKVYEDFHSNLFEAVKSNTPLSDEEWTVIVDEENNKLPILYQLTFEERDNLWLSSYTDKQTGLQMTFKEWSKLYYEKSILER